MTDLCKYAVIGSSYCNDEDRMNDEVIDYFETLEECNKFIEEDENIMIGYERVRIYEMIEQ